SATSHWPAEARQVVPAETKVQVAEQHDPAAPFDPPRSHCSVPSATPSPQRMALYVPMPADQNLLFDTLAVALYVPVALTIRYSAQWEMPAPPVPVEKAVPIAL